MQAEEAQSIEAHLLLRCENRSASSSPSSSASKASYSGNSVRWTGFSTKTLSPFFCNLRNSHVAQHLSLCHAHDDSGLEDIL